MTGRKSTRTARKRTTKQPAAQQTDDVINSPPSNRRQQQNAQQVAKKITKAENDEARLLKTVFKSNPDTQMKEFIRKAASSPTHGSVRLAVKTPADSHPPAVAQELLETDDDVADNLVKLFKASKSLKSV